MLKLHFKHSISIVPYDQIHAKTSKIINRGRTNGNYAGTRRYSVSFFE